MINFVCLKSGTKYDSTYVNRLYRMVSKNYSGQFTFHCCTDDGSGIDHNINIITLPNEYYIETWWWKLWILSKESPILGRCIFFDLDTVIQNDITEIVQYDPSDKIHLIYPQWKHRKRQTIWKDWGMPEYNSSIMIWNSYLCPDIFSEFIIDADIYMLKYVGNDEYMSEHCKDYLRPLPLNWVYSRLEGYDDTDPNRELRAIDPYQNRINLYNMPERMVCIFNGIRQEDNTDEDIYLGYEHYWSDSIS